MIRILRGGLRLINGLLRAAGRALACLGAVYVGPEAVQAIDPSRSAARPRSRLVRYAQARFLELPPGAGGPPPAHPERLRGDIPLSEQEMLLARELWPAHDHVRDGS
ncbi:DUF6059 family protein [Streptomyces sp. NBC_01334]|uniref:DUF6059 family protein n=1 Tax=Streptomyces sp. NBC_01334 TaxID=2903827 RepID=UPI002E1403D9|nr:hypothetical protein OG736_00455 [Streptomyces sp. NBC_01334]WSN45206.1 hypothetical protein OG736_44080 [Streptomyces sp. NBC_01334]